VRRLFGLLVALAVLVAALAVADIVVRHRVQSAIASRIEATVPGSHATVRIDSFPFVGRVVASGRVPQITADVTDVHADGLRFSRIDLTIHNLKVSRHQLTHGKVQALSISRGRVVAVVPQAEISAAVHTPLQLTAGHAQVNGRRAPATVDVAGGRLALVAPGLPALSVGIPELDILPCVSSARVVDRAVRLSCRFHRLPGFLSGRSFGV